MSEIVLNRFSGGVYRVETPDSSLPTLYDCVNVSIDETTGYLTSGYKLQGYMSLNGITGEVIKIISFRRLDNGKDEYIAITSAGIYRYITGSIPYWGELYNVFVSEGTIFDKVYGVLYLPNSIRVSISKGNGIDVYFVGIKDGQFVAYKNLVSDVTGFTGISYYSENTSVYDASAVDAKFNVVIVGNYRGIRYFLAKVEFDCKYDTIRSEIPVNILQEGFKIDFSNSLLNKIEVFLESIPMVRTGKSGSRISFSTDFPTSNVFRYNWSYSINLQGTFYGSLYFVFSRTGTSFSGNKLYIGLSSSYSEQFYEVELSRRVTSQSEYYKRWKTAVYHKGRVFVNDGSDTIYFSEIENGIEQHDKIPDGNFIKIPLGETEKIVKLVSKGDSIYIFRTGGIDAITTGNSVYESFYRKLLNVSIDDNPNAIVETQNGIVFSSGSYLYLWNYSDEPFLLNWQLADNRYRIKEVFYDYRSNELFYLIHTNDSYIYRVIFRYFSSINGRIVYPIFKYQFPNEILKEFNYTSVISINTTNLLQPDNLNVVTLVGANNFEGRIVTHNLLPPSLNKFVVDEFKIDFTDVTSCYIVFIYDRFSIGYNLAGSSIRINLRKIPTSRFMVSLSFLSSSNCKLKGIVYNVRPTKIFSSSKISDFYYPIIQGETGSLTSPNIREVTYRYAIANQTNTVLTDVTENYPQTSIKVYLNGVLLSYGYDGDYTLSIDGGKYRVNFNYTLYPGDIVQVDTEL